MLAIGLFCVVMVYVCCLLDFDVWAKQKIQSVGFPQCGFFQTHFACSRSTLCMLNAFTICIHACSAHACGQHF